LLYGSKQNFGAPEDVILPKEGGSHYGWAKNNRRRGDKMKKIGTLTAMGFFLGLLLATGFFVQREVRGEVKEAKILKANALIGTNVKNLQGEELGEIEELVIDPEEGRIAYAIVSFGGFWGVGNKLFAFHWSALTLNPDKQTFILDVDKEEFENAPGFDKDNWPEQVEHWQVQEGVPGVGGEFGNKGSGLTKIILQGVNFDVDKSEIKPEFVPVLEEAVRILKDNPEVRVRIEEHTDSIGTEAYNQALSEQRAQAVKDFLVSRGIEPSRLETVGYGESQPISDNRTGGGRAMNRRTVLKLVKE
jgi:outer membrane protein OmpA-like peptidoglycan-associated protein/sporulation protein YlmC with PRC-barrel domain